MSWEARRQAQARYEATPGGKATSRRYRHSEKGRRTGREYKRFRRRALKLGWLPSAARPCGISTRGRG